MSDEPVEVRTVDQGEPGRKPWPVRIALPVPVTIADPVEIVPPSKPWPVSVERSPVTIEGDLVTEQAPAQEGKTWSIASANTSAVFLTFNPKRVGATFLNDSTANLYLAFGPIASSSLFTIQLYPGQYYELPYRYTGQVSGVWASVNGNARVTEVL